MTSNNIWPFFIHIIYRMLVETGQSHSLCVSQCFMATCGSLFLSLSISLHHSIYLSILLSIYLSLFLLVSHFIFMAIITEVERNVNHVRTFPAESILSSFDICKIWFDILFYILVWKCLVYYMGCFSI